MSFLEMVAEAKRAGYSLREMLGNLDDHAQAIGRRLTEAISEPRTWDSIPSLCDEAKQMKACRAQLVDLIMETPNG